MAAHRLQADFAAFHAPAEAATEPQRSRTLRVAERLLLTYAPEPAVVAPDPLPADYTERRDDAILFLGRYLWETSGGTLSSTSVSGAVSDSFRDSQEVRRIVSEQMGEYATSAGNVKTVRIV